MNAPDDPRHGTNQGYLRIPCHDECCRRAHARYQNLYRAGRTQGSHDSTGVRRRIRALQAIGWTLDDIAKAGGWNAPQTVSSILYATHRRLVWTQTVRKVLRAWDALSMTPGPSEITRRKAARNGWPPPLAWDDDTIDDPKAKPYKPPAAKDQTVVDEVLVQRALNGVRVRTTKAEKREIIRRWQAAGRSINELDRIQGWNTHRLIRNTRTREETAA